MLKDVLFVWNSIPLNNELATASKRLDLNSLCIEDAILLAHPQTSFCGVHKLLQTFSKVADIDPTLLFANYGYALDSKLSHLLNIIPHLPENFLTWCMAHQISPRDLSPLMSLTNTHVLDKQLESLSSLSISRNLGAQILELLVECYLISPISVENLPTVMTGDAWLQQLKTLRFPQTQNSDDEKHKKMLALPWPKDFQLRWQRQGDRSGLEVKFFLSHERELKKITQLLHQTSNHIENAQNDLN